MNHTVSIVIFDPEDPDTLESLSEALIEYESVLIPYASKEALRGCHRPPSGGCVRPQASEAF